jgi:hypothetical protein
VAIDLGVRTFATLYSPNRTLEIGTNLIPIIDKHNLRIDKIKSNKDLNILEENKYKKLLYKYGNKMRNKIDDLHKKLSVYLVTNFKNIHLGKISNANVISNKKGNPRLEGSGRLGFQPSEPKRDSKKKN